MYSYLILEFLKYCFHPRPSCRLLVPSSIIGALYGRHGHILGSFSGPIGRHNINLGRPRHHRTIFRLKETTFTLKETHKPFHGQFSSLLTLCSLLVSARVYSVYLPYMVNIFTVYGRPS